MKKDTVVNMRIRFSDLELIDHAARVEGKSRSEMLRECAERAALAVFAKPQIVSSQDPKP